jgi:TonB family protein
MSEAVVQHEFTLTPFDTRPVEATILRTDRQFNIALVVATVAHVLFLTSFISAGVRQIGDPGGSRDGISVEIVTDADLKALGTVAERAAGPLTPPAPPPSPPQQTAALPPEPPAPEPPPPEPQAQPEAVPLPPPEPQAQPKSAPQAQPKPTPPEQAAVPEPALEQFLKIPQQAALPHSLDPPKPHKPPESAKPAKPEEARRPHPKQRMRTSALDLTLPPSAFAAPSGGGGAGIERPAGITRSGENDAFARGVIAALQRTMPQLRDTHGRVTVRIKLDKDGSLVATEVVRPSNIGGLDQNVVFATRQSSFPFPPRNANSADLTFLVTYIYR